jgi:hypothetical protein
MFVARILASPTRFSPKTIPESADFIDREGESHAKLAKAAYVSEGLWGEGQGARDEG